MVAKVCCARFQDADFRRTGNEYDLGFMLTSSASPEGEAIAAFLADDVHDDEAPVVTNKDVKARRTAEEHAERYAKKSKRAKRHSRQAEKKRRRKQQHAEMEKAAAAAAAAAREAGNGDDGST